MMGSMSMYSVLERVAKTFEQDILKSLSGIIGATIGEITDDDLEVSHWICADIPLTNSPDWNDISVHFRWSTEEEFHLGNELESNIVEDFNIDFSGRQIISIELDNVDRDDEVYLFAHTNNGHVLEIPLGFNPITNEFTGYLRNILSEEQRKLFLIENI